MKQSEKNLMVINNFILYYTHDDKEMNCDQMYQAAINYIKEDHVDGEPADNEEVEPTKPTNVQLYIESTQGISQKEQCEKYNLNPSVVECMVNYGREEHHNTTYWNEYLKPLLSLKK